MQTRKYAKYFDLFVIGAIVTLYTEWFGNCKGQATGHAQLLTPYEKK
jgi:hypothetical protein